MKDGRLVSEILDSFDLTGSLRAAGELAGCSPNTVAGWVAKRDRGELGGLVAPARRGRVIDPFMGKIEEWVEHSKGKIRAGKAHKKLLVLGCGGSDRTTRRAVASVEASWRAGRLWVYRPWIVEPGMWAQWDWGQGPQLRCHLPARRSRRVTNLGWRGVAIGW